MKSLALVVAALAAGTGVTGPAELLNDDVPNGFELADGAVADLTFEEYAPLAPEAIAHVDATSAEARAMRAAVDVWTAGEGDILLREVTMWTTDEAARAFVEQAVVVSTANELDAADAPFEGGIAFLGADEGLWTRTLTWRQGRYGITVSHYAIEEGTDEPIGDAAGSLAANTESATGHPIAAGGVLPASADATAQTSGDGIPIGTVLIWVVAIIGAVWLFVKVKQIVAGRPGAEPDDVDDLIENTRARHRGEREIETVPDLIEDRTPSRES